MNESIAREKKRKSCNKAKKGKSSKFKSYRKEKLAFRAIRRWSERRQWWKCENKILKKIKQVLKRDYDF